MTQSMAQRQQDPEYQRQMQAEQAQIRHRMAQIKHKLREKGFHAGADMTIREIVATGGVPPSAMRDILAQ